LQSKNKTPEEKLLDAMFGTTEFWEERKKRRLKLWQEKYPAIYNEVRERYKYIDNTTLLRKIEEEFPQQSLMLEI